MLLPQRIEEWTYETVAQIVRESEYEPGLYDFKEALHPRRELPQKAREEMLASLQRTVCGMANTDGGFIIFGVSDRGHNGSSPDERIVGVQLGGDLRKEFGDKLKVIQPPVYFNAIPAPLLLPSDPTKGIFIVHIPSSPLRPHMVETNYVFYRRGEGGSAVEMRRHEVRDQMLYTEERLRKVTLLRLEIAQYLEQVHKIEQEPTSTLAKNITAHFDTGAFKLILADSCIFLPTAGDLLKNLLEIPVLANLTQDALQNRGTGPAKVRAAELKFFCQNCEQQLQKLFGPLGSEGRPLASS